ncbi:MAG: hypothetical protein RLZZ385_1260 [Pseudomonadota bacterium]
MNITMYQSSIPLFQRFLDNLSGILEKAATFAAEEGMDEKVLTGYRLYPNMFPLSRQVQIACDVIKGAGARLAGVEMPSFADTEVTFDELQARIEKTQAFLETLLAEQIDGTEGKEIKLKIGDGELVFQGAEYLHYWVLPNMYFHITTAYNILRHVGVDLGKADFLGAR